ncbi:hypothetical protein RND71_015250 [Anisodus tanguticus]|uniref:Uncharacterized protein n=1 Tax=Anisodus tanguticus TaxID=243964 RepID=A0AAE1VCP1_9SOLA|nr:hypothetical protein RND71_015250 [Anisodus tanguticus]
MQRSEYKANGLGFTVAEKISANNPLVEIGSRGTVGSLVLREIEYFDKLQLNHHNRTHKVCCSDSPKMLPHIPNSQPSTLLKSLTNIARKPRQVSDVASTSSYTRPKLRSLVTNPKKKRKNSKLMMPSMCSMVEVAECNSPTAISRFTYRNLKADV